MFLSKLAQSPPSWNRDTETFKHHNSFKSSELHRNKSCSRLNSSKRLNHNHAYGWFPAAHPCFTFYILHDHAEVPSSFKRAEHGNNEGVLSKSKDVPLHKSLLDLVPQDQVLTIYLFHGKPLAGLLVADQIHSPVKKNKENIKNQVSYVHIKLYKGPLLFTLKHQWQGIKVVGMFFPWLFD